MELREATKPLPILVLLGSILFTACHAGEVCPYFSEDGFLRHKYCRTGCCGDFENADCCWTASASLIVGIVVGCICLLAVIATLIMCVIHAKTKRKRQVNVSTIRPTAFVVPPPYPGYGPPPAYNSNLRTGQYSNYPPPPAYQAQAWETGQFSYVPTAPPPPYQGRGGSSTQPTNQNSNNTFNTTGPANQDPFAAAAGRSMQETSFNTDEPTDPTTYSNRPQSNSDYSSVLNLRTAGRPSLPPINTRN